MRVFISWSGQRSRLIAEALKEWLPIQSVEAWISSQDIDKGARSLDEINSQLKDAQFGIVCLTPENLNEKWIHFEAGAIARTIAVDKPGRVWTYLTDLVYSDVQGPLAQFQHTITDKDDTKKLLMAVNKATDKPILETKLETFFNALWPNLESKLKTIGENLSEIKLQRRSPDSMLEELLELIRSLIRDQPDGHALKEELLKVNKQTQLITSLLMEHESVIDNSMRKLQRFKYETMTIPGAMEAARRKEIAMEIDAFTKKIQESIKPDPPK